MNSSDEEELPELVDSSDDELDVSSHNSTSGYAMVMHQTKTKNDHGVARKVRFENVPNIVEDEHIPCKVSYVPSLPDQGTRSATKIKYQKKAFELHQEVNGLDSKSTENANSFFCEGQALTKSPSNSCKGASA